MTDARITVDVARLRRVLAEAVAAVPLAQVPAEVVRRLTGEEPEADVKPTAKSRAAAASLLRRVRG